MESAAGKYNLCEILKYIYNSDINFKSYAINPLSRLISHFSTGTCTYLKISCLNYYGIYCTGMGEVGLLISPVFH